MWHGFGSYLVYGSAPMRVAAVKQSPPLLKYSPRLRARGTIHAQGEREGLRPVIDFPGRRVSCAGN